MDRTIILLNITHFRRLLATNLDHDIRRTVQQLLAEAQADLDGLNGQPSGRVERVPITPAV
jgi:hypothetical protein